MEMVTPEMHGLLDALGANQKGRGGRTLLDHLEGTRAVLARWGSPPEICLAGLFHSVYGAEGGRARDRDANLARRDDVRALIGASAEELAYLYAACERRSLFTNATDSSACVVNDLFEKRERPVSETTLRSLLQIEAANLVEGPLERFDSWPDGLLVEIEALWENARPLVPARAYAELRSRFLALDERRARP
jgi:hypothetical protein